MLKTPSANNEAPDDRSTRARIRDAALAQFAEHGLKGATIRGIASQAGVSPGAVQAHFPTKDALREACDAHVLSVIRQTQGQIVSDIQQHDRAATALSDPAFMAGVDRTMQPILDYLATSMASGSDTAARWFDELYAVVHGMLTDGTVGPGLPDSSETRDVAAVLTAMQLGLTLMFDRVLDAMGTSHGDPEAMVRLGRARLHVATQRLISAEFEARIHAALDSYERAHGTTDAPGTATSRDHTGSTGAADE